MEQSERTARMEAIVKRTDKFLPFFDSELYKEWAEILAKKIEAYRLQLEKSPRIGDVVYAESTEITGDRKSVTRVPFKVTKDEQDEYVAEYTHKINELKSVLDMPALMKADADRMRAEMAKIGDKQ